MVTISKYDFENPRFQNLLARRSSIPESVEITVKEVLKNVKEKGDAALHAYMQKFDGVDIGEIGLMVSDEEFENGAVLERKYTALNSVAVTIPGDMAPLISTLCMNLVPAVVASVPNIYILTKPKKDGSIDDRLLYVADLELILHRAHHLKVKWFFFSNFFYW